MTIQLQNDWRLDYGQFTDLNTQLPTSMYTVLLSHGLIEDPYYRVNEFPARELSRQNAVFYTRFQLNEKELAYEHLVLRFECIDTIAQIYLNDVFIGSSNSMFARWDFDCIKAAVIGTNLLKIEIKSPILYAEQAHDRYPLWGMPESMTMRGYSHIRKAHCMFGWDWGPQLPDMGIYRDISLLAYNGAIIEDFSVKQTHDENGTVRLLVSVDFSDGLSHEATVVVTDPNGEQIKAPLSDNECTFIINNPQLWWPNGYGDHPLYTVTVSMNAQDSIKTHKIGLRTLTVSTRKDEWGNEFAFVVNGKKIFSMGADYIPEDCLIPRMTYNKTHELINSCVAANFNTLRVWGGGFYPDDYFYDLCDQYGLIVWQDFMFACAVYNVTDEFEEILIKEFEHNIRRLRNHACLGLLCGNNEMEVAWVDWNITQDEKIKQDYIYLFERLLPRMVKKYAPDIFYWPASPSKGGGFNDPNDYNSGDVHYWEVWHGSKPFEEYRKYFFRYCSEFGFESFPSISTIKSFAENEDINPFSRVMESHQKCEGGNKKILSYLADYYLYPKNFETFIYASQLLQADAIKYGVEHMRRHRGRCMGAVYWQLNDIWPGPSWSSIDYYSHWKALHYYARRFFAPVLLSVHSDNKSATFNISNETMYDIECTIKAGLRSNSFDVIEEYSFSCSVGALSSLDIGQISLAAITEDEKRYNTYLYYQLYDKSGRIISSESILFVKPKHYSFERPEITASVREQEGEFVISCTAARYAKSVYISLEELPVKLSDNFFDLVGTDPYEITITPNNAADITINKIQNALKITSVWDIAG